MSGKIAGKYQPAKMAAFEGIYQTKRGHPSGVIGYVDPQSRRLSELQVPKMLSFLIQRF